MKIKDIKGIAEKLPRTADYELIEDIDNTDIAANECCEVDVEKVQRVVMLKIAGCDLNSDNIAEAIAKAGIIKWREK